MSNKKKIFSVECLVSDIKNWTLGTLRHILYNLEKRKKKYENKFKKKKKKESIGRFLKDKRMFRKKINDK